MIIKIQTQKTTLKNLLEDLKDRTNWLSNMDIRSITAPEDFKYFYEFGILCRRVGIASDSDKLTELQKEVCIGYLDNAQNAYSSIYRDFKEKYNREGRNLYHTEQENFEYALEFAKMVEYAYDFDLIALVEKENAEDMERIRRNASISLEESVAQLRGFLLPGEEDILL